MTKDGTQVIARNPGKRPLAGKRILIIDDEIQLTTLMLTVLTGLGAKIDFANSGLQALERIQSQPYDIFICDQWMPDLTGERLYESVESIHPEFRHRFLFMTGDVLGGNTMEFFKQKGVDYIQKPFRTAELLELIESILNRTQ